ncbi:uncharacterized protein LOC142168935 [Nicotiana tabacum]|uniref:Uncharacterized protein LOC142168935 n=1 Tax=Nicotiana tabacum TaxID=4097 RepID=A0AC58SMM3_TOBAC
MIFLSEFDIVYITQKDIKGQALADHLTENPVDGDYELLTMYFTDEEVLFDGEDIAESYPGWRIFFGTATNFKGVGIGAVLISESGQHYPASAKIRFPCTNNMDEYEACILGIRMAVNMNIKELLVIRDSDLLIHQVQGKWFQNAFADALATLSSMIQHPHKNYIDPIEVEIRDKYAYCFHVDEEPDGKPWYHDIKRFLTTRECPENATNGQMQALRRLANNVFLNGEVLYRRTPDLGYRTTMRTSTGPTPYMLVYGTEAVLPAEVDIPSLRVIQEAKLDNAEWIRVRQEQFMLIYEKRIDAVCHGRLYQNRMACAFNKRVKPCQFTPGQLVLKKIFPHQEEEKRKVHTKLEKSLRGSPSTIGWISNLGRNG